MKLPGTNRKKEKNKGQITPENVTEENLQDLSGRMNDLEAALTQTRAQLAQDQKRVEEQRAKKMTWKATLITAAVLFAAGLVVGLLIAART